QGLRRLRVTQGVGNIQVVHAGDGDDVAGAGAVDLDAVEAEKPEYRGHLAAPGLAVAIDNRDRRRRGQLPAGNAADADLADEAVVVQRRDLHLKRTVEIDR